MAAAKRNDFRLSFLGATGTVTGSRYLVEADGKQVLVDCGLFQGYKQLRLRNWAPFPVAPASLDAVLLTHAHLDHAGYLPLLARNGYRGPVHCTPATAALSRILLPDSGHLLEEEARYANKKGSSKHHPALPLYTQEDAQACLRQFAPHPFDTPFALGGTSVTAAFRHAGHILGAASVTLECDGTRITFSGDVGRPHDPVMRAPAPLAATDILVIESTYGDRLHPTTDPQEELGPILSRVAARGGVVVIPAFAVGRAQALIHLVAQLKANGAIPKALPVYLNSPMATDATALYHQFRGDHRLSTAECDALHTSTTVINTAEESKALNRRGGPMVIISASGMATGGRVVHHLKAFAPDSRNAIVLAGYQAGGTRGASLAAGASSIRIFGENIPVRAEVVQLSGASAHADADELLAWMGAIPVPPKRVFITHGEPAAADALRQRIERLGWEVTVPDFRDTVDLHAIRGGLRAQT